MPDIATRARLEVYQGIVLVNDVGCCRTKIEVPLLFLQAYSHSPSSRLDSEHTHMRVLNDVLTAEKSETQGKMAAIDSHIRSTPA